MSKFSLRLGEVCYAREERAVLGGVSLSLNGGECAHLRGKNGAGKSTLLKIICGFLAPDSGRAEINGAPAARAAREAVLHIGHENGAKPDLTLRESLRAHLLLCGGDESDGNEGEKKDEETQIGAALDYFNLSASADILGRELSQGQRRRGALARLLLSPRPLWALDEPLAAMDETGAARFHTLLEKHLAGGGAAVIAAHDPLPLPDVKILSLPGPA